MKETLFNIGEIPITWASLLLFFIVLVVTFGLGFYIKWAMRKVAKRNVQIAAIGRFVRYGIYLIGVLIACSLIGLSSSIFAFIAGAFTLWLGIALGPLVTNLFSGAILLTTRSLRIGEMIQLPSGEKGRVALISLQMTGIDPGDGRVVYVPNSDLFTKKLTKFPGE